MATRFDPIAAIQQQRARPWTRTRASRPPKVLRPVRRWVFAAIGIRTLFRNPRRSLITLSGIAFAMAALLFLWAFFEGYSQQIIDNATGYETGHLQVSRAGFRQELTPDYALADPEPLLVRVRELPGVVGVTPRILTQALLGTGRKSAGGFLMGIDPVRESSVTALGTGVRQGRFLAASDRNTIVLGKRLADKLRATLGDKVVVYAQAAGGDVGAGAYRVVGLLESGVFNLDASYAFVPLGAAQQLLGLDRGVSAVAVRLADRWQIAKATAALRTAAPRGAEVLPWSALLPIVTQTQELLNVMLWIILLVVFLVVAVGVMNTILMSTLGRTREIGLMAALGTRPGQVVRQILAESCALAIAGIVLGALLGSAVAWYAGLRGIDLRPYMGQITAIPGFSGLIRPVILPGTLLVAALWLLGIVLLVSFYPAWRASRLDPVESIARE